MPLYLGADPGASGGLAVLNEDGTIYRHDKAPVTDADLLALLHAITEDGTRRVVGTVEYVSAIPKMGVVSAFSFGKGYGGLLMALCAANVPYDIVTPPVWQKAMQCRSHGDKNITKRRAQQLWPGAKITHATADALLMAEYTRRRGGIAMARAKERQADDDYFNFGSRYPGQ